MVAIFFLNQIILTTVLILNSLVFFTINILRDAVYYHDFKTALIKFLKEVFYPTSKIHSIKRLSYLLNWMKLKKVDFINLENKIKYQLELHEKSQTIENSLAFIYNILKWEIFTFYNPKSNIGLDY